jgi:hypothetical protein
MIKLLGLLAYWSIISLKPSRRNTEMASKKNTVDQKFKNASYDNLTKALFEILDPYVTAVDEVPAGRDIPEGDTGHETKSSQDMSIRMLLGTTMSYAHRQLYGPIRGKNGQSYDSASVMYKKNCRALEEIEKQLSSGRDEDNRPLSTQAIIRLTEDLEKRMHYHKRNTEWCTVLESILTAFGTVHAEITRTDWKPMTDQTLEAGSILKNATPAEAEELKKQALASLAKMRKAA